MRFAYADPPYLGCGVKHYGALHEAAAECDSPEWHRDVGVAYAWEPVIVRGGRKRTRQQDTVRDWCAANITLKRGLTGAKPEAFTRWILDVLNAEPDDEIVDLFPGSGAVQKAIDAWREAMTGHTQIGLWA